MDEFDLSLFSKTYELYKALYLALQQFPKVHRYALGQRCELVLSDVVEAIWRAAQLPKNEKLPLVEQASRRLNLLRVYLRLSKDTKALDVRRYATLQESVDEIGRMLGGWMGFLEGR